MAIITVGQLKALELTEQFADSLADELGKDHERYEDLRLAACTARVALKAAARDAALRRGVERLRDEYRSIGWLNNTGARLVGADVVAQLDALLRAGEETGDGQ